jgi:hypothetical protein
MATVQELFAAKAEGRQAFFRGEIPSYHPQFGGGELYEAWYDGWDAAQQESYDNLMLSKGYSEY